MPLNTSGLDDVFAGLDMTVTPSGAPTSAPLDTIEPDPDQPRKNFDPAELADLAASIKANGIIQPLVVRTHPRGSGYLLVAGERRLRAARMIGLNSVPIVISELADENKTLVVQLVENIMRDSLTPMETYRGLTRLLESMNATQITQEVGKSKTWVSRYLSIGKMPQNFQDALNDGRATDINAITQLFQIYKSTPQPVDRLLASGAPISRHAVQQIQTRLADSAAQVDADGDADARTNRTAAAPAASTKKARDDKDSEGEDAGSDGGPAEVRYAAGGTSTSTGPAEPFTDPTAYRSLLDRLNTAWNQRWELPDGEHTGQLVFRFDTHNDLLAVLRFLAHHTPEDRT